MDQNPWNQGQNYWPGGAYRHSPGTWPNPMPGQPPTNQPVTQPAGQNTALQNPGSFAQAQTQPLTRAERMEAEREAKRQREEEKRQRKKVGGIEVGERSRDF